MLLSAAAMFSSLPADFLVKSTGKSAFLTDGAEKLPYVDTELYRSAMVRAALLNCLTRDYTALWESLSMKPQTIFGWSKDDPRLNKCVFDHIGTDWTWETPLRSDYSRRQALVEIDVITAISLGMTLEQLISIYRIQFSILKSQEENTWYDTNGRIVFTTDRSLTGVGFDSKTWENELKDAPAGKKFYRTIMDDTMPGGPVERTIEYVAPFDRCDRERDYETAWKFFEEKYKEV